MKICKIYRTVIYSTAKSTALLCAYIKILLTAVLICTYYIHATQA